MMRKPGKVVIVSQHYPPDSSTTAAIMAAISNQLAQEFEVLVVSGTAGSASVSGAELDIVEVVNWMPSKGALVRRAFAEVLFTCRIFATLLLKLRRGDVALTVPAPFMLPYAFAAAASLRGARSVLIMHDLYPEVLILAGLLKEQSMLAKAVRALNAIMFRALDAVVIIGRDTEKLLLRYGGMTRNKIHFIPNWATIAPGLRAVTTTNPYRRPLSAPFVVGLSGNLGFTHDPVIVFEAAKLLRDNRNIHFLLSGWGVGFDQLQEMQSAARLSNVTLVSRVKNEELEAFLSAADVWIIPYRKSIAGVSVPSRFYNLLAIGRPVILVSEPDAEAALTVTEHNVGWVVAPGNAEELASAVVSAAGSDDPQRAKRAIDIAKQFDLGSAMASYCSLIRHLLHRNAD